ncbi:SIR2-domain-containing protein, partial [Exidia glandulosa HHB12029]
MEPPSSTSKADIASDFADECNNADTLEELEEILESLSDSDAQHSPDNGDAENGDADDRPHPDVDGQSDMEEDALIEEAKEQMPSDAEVEEMTTKLKERGIIAWLQEYVVQRRVPLKRLLLAYGIVLTPETAALDEVIHLRLLKAALTRVLRKREKLEAYNTIDDVLVLLKRSKRVMVLTGAGISVSCGIPDFRSRDGIYAMLADKPELQLDDPQQMFDIDYFKENPAIFYSFASHIYPSKFKPSPCHHFIKLLEDKNILLRNYTQNIDTLEHAAGVRRVLQCHGSFATATCVQCGEHVAGQAIEADILAQRIPYCSSPRCAPANTQPALRRVKKKPPKPKGAKPWEVDEEEDELVGILAAPGIMKPDITFFGEKLTDDFDRLLFEDREKVDLLLIMGTSLAVAPVADVLSHIPHSVPQVLINKTPVAHANTDVMLLGDADTIVQYICDELGWTLPGVDSRKRRAAAAEPRRVGASHVWLFEGSEGGRWLQRFQDGVCMGTSTQTVKRLRVV